jgi:transcription elongation factor SPT6
MMTAADEEMRELDKPERLQIATADLNADRTADLTPILAEEELNAATEWVAPRISAKLSASFLVQTEGGFPHPLRDAFMMAVRFALEHICHRFLEPPFCFLHRRDFFVHYDPQNPVPALQYCDLLGRGHLWTIQALGIKYRAFLDRRAALRELFASLQEPVDEAFEEAFARLESSEEVNDLSDWVNVHYSRQIKRLKEVANEQEAEATQSQGGVKRATRETRYSRIRNTEIYQLAQVRRALSRISCVR